MIATQPRLSLSDLAIQPDMPICQTDLPLDWYQEQFKPYAEEYLALPDRLPSTVLPWMDSYIRPALDHFGDSIMLLAWFENSVWNVAIARISIVVMQLKILFSQYT